ncbi:MAG: hypothetical protein U5L04_11235, partial [Trueperaceae bacterium]|nr:hypothetical protein [Trueperaceae bacterium]
DLANTRVRGGLTLGRSSVAAPLENAVLGGSLFVDTFAVAGQPLSAEITLAGDVSEPRADVTLRGQGTATGALTATLTPDAVRLQSDLRLAEVTSDVDLTLTRQQLGGAGEVRWRDYRVTFVSEEERQLQLVGADALAGWRGVIDLGAVNLGATDGSDGGRLSLSGDLASLDGPLAGRVRLEVVPNDEVWLEATLQDVRVAGRALGDVTVRGQNEATGRTLAVTGDVVAARAELTPEFRWALAGLELPLTDTLTLNATGSGTLTSGAVDAVVGGTLGGGVGELELPVSARYQGAALALDIEDGALLGGTVRGALRFDDGWSGTVDVSGASLVGGELGLNTTLAGPLARPELRADSRFRLGAYALSGQVTASRSRLQFEQTLDAPSLAGPVAISGEVWPGLELTLQQGDDTLTVRNGGSLQAFGTLALDLGPARLRLGAGTGDTLLVGEVSSPRLPGLVLNAQLPRNLAQLRDGLSITTGETARGTIRLLPGGGASVTAFRWDGPYGPVTVDGELRQNGVGLVGQLTGRWRPDARSTSPLSVLTPLSLDLALTPNTATLVSQSEAGALRFALDRGSGDAEAFGSLSVGAGRLELDVRYRPDTGPQGRLELRDIPLQLTDNAPTLDSEVFFDPDELRGTLSLVTESGDARLATRLGWRRLLPAALHDAVPQGSTIRSSAPARTSPTCGCSSASHR